MAHAFHIIETGKHRGKSIGQILGFYPGNQMLEAERLSNLADLTSLASDPAASHLDKAAAREMVQEYGWMLNQ